MISRGVYISCTYSASSFESKMLTFLLFSFRTRGPRKMIFCICNYQSFVSVCAEYNLGSVNIHRIIILIWHGGLVINIGLAEVFKAKK